MMSVTHPILTSLLSLWLLGTPTCVFTCLVSAPLDRQQLEHARLTYVHVASARLSIGVYVASSITCLAYLVTKHPLVLLAARYATALGAWYTATVVVTGWVRGHWLMGGWWGADARLTSVLLSFLLLAGSVRYQLHHVDPGPFSLLLGWIDLPFLKSAVHWWNTLHQLGSISRSGSALHEPMSHCLWCLVGFETIGCLVLFVLETRVPIPTHTELRSCPP